MYNDIHIWDIKNSFYVRQFIVVCHIFVDIKESDVKMKCFNTFLTYGLNTVIFYYFHKS